MYMHNYCYTALTNNFPCEALSAGHWSCTVANGRISVAFAGAIAELRPSPITEILPIRPPIYYGGPARRAKLSPTYKVRRSSAIYNQQSTIDNAQSTIDNRQSTIHKVRRHSNQVEASMIYCMRFKSTCNR